VLLVLLALSACHQASPRDSELATALLKGDEQRAQTLTNDIIAGRRAVTKTELMDERPVAPNVLLRTTSENRDYQLGVGTVSEYALCVLQIRAHTSSANVLRVVAPALERQCSAQRPCEVCNAQAFPVGAEVKRQLVSYWMSRVE
jgi:hypothetical protein